MFGEAVDAAIKAHALAEYPRECCGLVIDGVYVPQLNILHDSSDVLADPYDHFRMPVGAWPTDGRKVQAVVHSHCAPRHVRVPSFADSRDQIETNVPWGLVLTDGHECTDILWWGDFRLDEPLFDAEGQIIGAPFSWVVADCWTVVRRFHWQAYGIKRPDFPRGHDECNSAPGIFLPNVEAAGLAPIDLREAVPGDVLFFNIRRPFPNHCAVVTDNELMIHVLPGGLINRQPLNRWHRQITHSFRFRS